MSARLRDIDDDAHLADVLNQWDAHAQIKEERVARATQNEAEAEARLRLQASVDGQFAAVTQQFTAQAAINGYQAAQYLLAVTVGAGSEAVVGGMQIAGTSSAEQGPRIAIQFATDSYRIVSPDGSKKTVPFYVQTSDTVVNGVKVYAGVYMDSAVIGSVEALWGRFGSLRADTIQATAISASQLTAGNGVIGGSLKSANYVSGSSGWILRPDGVAEFSGVVVRGVIYATSGSIGGITINSNGLSAGSFTGYAWPAGTGTGFHLGPRGLMFGNPSTGKYFQVSENGDMKAPGLSVVDGKAVFEGQMTAGGLRSKDGKFVIDLDAKFISIEV
jgi:hypothetical protein